MVEIPTDEKEPGTIVQEMQSGYMIKDRLLRLLFFDAARFPSLELFILIVFFVKLVFVLLWLIAIVCHVIDCLVVSLFRRQLLAHLLKDLSVLRRPLEHFEAWQRCVVGICFLPFHERLVFFDAKMLEAQLL